MLVEKRGGTEEQRWLNSVVEQWNSDGRTMWWNTHSENVKQR